MAIKVCELLTFSVISHSEKNLLSSGALKVRAGVSEVRREV